MDNKALFNISRVGFDPAESAACIGTLSKQVEALQAENARLVQERDELAVVVSYLDTKIKSATMAHERAVPFLLDEALERTHLDFHRNQLTKQAEELK